MMLYSRQMVNKYNFYKVQFYNETSLAWVDKQQRYPNRQEALSSIPNKPDKSYRLIHVTDKLRMPITVKFN